MIRPYYDEAGIQIFHGDCREVLPQLGRVDVVITDPPYGMNYRSNYRLIRFHTIESDAGWDGQLHPAWIHAVYEILTENGVCCLFVSDHAIGKFRDSLDIAGFNVKRTLVWVKNNWSAGDLEADWACATEFILHAHKGRRVLTGNRDPNTLYFDRLNGSELLHPTEKPMELLGYLIRKFDAAVILDPFMGSGTTLVAAKNLGRRAIGIEIEEKYCAIAVERLRQSVFEFK